MRLAGCLLFLVFSSTALADDCAKIKSIIAKYVTPYLSDSILTEGCNSAFNSVKTKASLDDAADDLKNKLMSKIMAQTKFIGPAFAFMSDVPDAMGLIDKFMDIFGPKLTKIYNNIKKKNPKNMKKFANLVAKVATKKFFVNSVAEIKANLDATTWKYAVNDLYDVVNFKFYGIKKIS